MQDKLKMGDGVSISLEPAEKQQGCEICGEPVDEMSYNHYGKRYCAEHEKDAGMEGR